MQWDLWPFLGWTTVPSLVEFHPLALNLCRSSKIVLLVWFLMSVDGPAPLLPELHWLPVQQRINFKILLHVYNCVNSKGTSYLSNAVSHYHCARARLRSSKDTICLAVHINNLAIGTTAFSYLGSKLWNDLPVFIRTACGVQSFKKIIKTHLFPSDWFVVVVVVVVVYLVPLIFKLFI